MEEEIKDTEEVTREDLGDSVDPSEEEVVNRDTDNREDLETCWEVLDSREDREEEVVLEDSEEVKMEVASTTLEEVDNKDTVTKDWEDLVDSEEEEFLVWEVEEVREEDLEMDSEAFKVWEVDKDWEEESLVWVEEEEETTWEDWVDLEVEEVMTLASRKRRSNPATKFKSTSTDQHLEEEDVCVLQGKTHFPLSLSLHSLHLR